MKKLFCFALSVVAISLSNAQTFSGRIVDEQAEPLPFANVVLLEKADSSFIQGTVTDINGLFSIDNNRRDALLRVSCVGYVTTYKAVESGIIGDIQIFTDVQMFDDVEVRATMPTHSTTAEGLLTNVENTVISRMGTGNDVLRCIPGMQQNSDGSYNVFGRGEPIFYINGRLVHDLSELDRLKSEDIKSVELITTPGARYDASVSAVVKIKTKRQQGEGVSVSNRAVCRVNDYADWIEQLDMNYRHNNLDIFANLYVNHLEGENTTYGVYDVKSEKSWTIKNDWKYKFCSKLLDGEFGMNYIIDEANSLGFKYELSKSPKTYSNALSVTSMTLEDVLYDQTKLPAEYENETKPQHYANIYYNGKMADFAIDFNFDWKTTNNSETQDYEEVSQEYNDRNFATTSHVKNKLYAAKLVLGHSLAGGNIDLGIEWTRTNRNDDYISSENYIPTTFTELKDYSYAPFFEYSHSLPIGNVSAGLRYEHAAFDYYDNGEYVAEQSRSFDNLFPSLSFSAKVRNVNILLGYSSTINRPTYSSIKGNVTYVNRFVREVGDPYLKPSITNDLSLQTSWKIFAIIANYNIIKDGIERWTKIDSGDLLMTLTNTNIEKYKELSAYFVASPRVRIWSPQIVAGVSKQWLTLHRENDCIDMNKPLYIMQLNNTFEFSNTLIADASLQLITKGDQGNMRFQKCMPSANVSLTKTFFNDCLSVRLAGYDLFKPGQKLDIKMQNVDARWKLSNDSRFAELTIRYKWNAANNKYKGTGAGNDEKQRL